MKKSFILFFVIIGCVRDKGISPNLKYLDLKSGVVKYLKQKVLISDVIYGTDPLNKMDICLPMNRTGNTGVIVFIHGGAWVAGDKLDFRNEIMQFADSGFACVSINYRLADSSKNILWFDLVNDVRDAVTFIKENSDNLYVSSDKIGLVGHSAGGHLSLLSSYIMNSDKSIKTCCSVAGPTNFIDSSQRTIIGLNIYFTNVIGQDLINAHDTILYKQASPYWRINTEAVPTILIHGISDEKIAPSNSIKLHGRLDSLGLANSLVLIPNQGHDCWQEAKKYFSVWFKQQLN